MMKALLALAWAVAGSSCSAFAAAPAPERSGLDVSFKTGMLTGKLTVLDPQGGKSQIYTFAGLPIGIAFNHAVSPKTTVSLLGEVVMDSANTQISRQSFGGGVSYSFYGGAADYPLVDHGAYAVRADGGGWAAALIAQGNVERYAVVSKTKAASGTSTNSTFAGTAVDLQAGLEGRRNFGAASSLGVQFLTSIFSLPASSQQFGATTTEMLIVWRMRL